MENVNNNANMNNAANAEEVKSDAVVNDTVEIGLDNVMGDILMSALKREKTGVWHQDNKNLIGGLIGAGIAVGLEVASPTGSIASATAAALVSGGTLMVTHKVMDVAPQTTGIAAAHGALTAFVGMTAGRIVADYFPGNLTSGE